MPKPVRASSTANTARATERAGEVLVGSIGVAGGRGKGARARVCCNKTLDGAAQAGRDDPYSTQHDLHSESSALSWLNAPAWETSCVP